MSYQIDGEEYVDVDEAVGLLAVKKATLYAYVSRGVITSYRQAVGRRRLYRRADVLALLQVRPDSAAPEHDRVLRDVALPPAESWACDH